MDVQLRRGRRAGRGRRQGRCPDRRRCALAHRLQLQVEITADDVLSAADAAKNWAESVLTLLTGAARAPAGPAELEVAYEITPGIREREFAQWYTDVPVLLGKTPVTREAFGALFEPLLVFDPGISDERLSHRMMLSVSWHRLAMAETDRLTPSSSSGWHLRRSAPYSLTTTASSRGDSAD